MNIKNNILIILFTIFFLSSCSSMNEAGKFLRNERINTTDEFLIKKRQPLTEPPDINKIPQPNNNNSLNAPDFSSAPWSILNIGRGQKVHLMDFIKNLEKYFEISGGLFSRNKSIVIVIYNNQNQKSYIGVKLE